MFGKKTLKVEDDVIVDPGEVDVELHDELVHRFTGLFVKDAIKQIKKSSTPDATAVTAAKAFLTASLYMWAKIITPGTPAAFRASMTDILNEVVPTLVAMGELSNPTKEVPPFDLDSEEARDSLFDKCYSNMISFMDSQAHESEAALGAGAAKVTLPSMIYAMLTKWAMSFNGTPEEWVAWVNKVLVDYMPTLQEMNIPAPHKKETLQ